MDNYTRHDHENDFYSSLEIKKHIGLLAKSKRVVPHEKAHKEKVSL